jgi:long-chain fatty acid transport protein
MQSALRPRVVWLALLVVYVISVQAYGQSNDPLNSNLQFNFANPGARSLALGGAFTALADDATAAYANPAGLTVLRHDQVALELRNSSYENTFVSGGTYSSTAADPGAGLQLGSYTNNAVRPTFLSLMIPREKWAFGIYRHEVSHFTNKTNLGTLRVGTTPIAPDSAHLSLNINNWGLSGALKLTDLLSVGGGLSYYKGTLDAVRTAVAPAGLSSVAQGEVLTTTTENASGSYLGGNIGVLFRPGRWSFGASYKRGPRFIVENVVTRRFEGEQRQDSRMQLPDVYSLGIAFRQSPSLVVSMDLREITYKIMTRHTLVDVVSSPNEAVKDNVNLYRASTTDELHVGLEKVFEPKLSTMTAAALRLGSWYEPAHRIEYFGANTARGPFQAALFPRGEAQTHFTAGGGVVVGRSLQIDAGIDFARRSKIISLSMVHEF